LLNQSVPCHLVVTQWNEIGVLQALTKANVEFSFINGVGNKWSHSQVFNNAHLKFPNENIFWTTVDVSFEKNFFSLGETILNKYNFITSWPNSNLSSTLEKSNLSTGLDTIGISHRVIDFVAKRVMEYPNIGWGLFEHQLVAFSQEANVYNKKGKNLVKYSFVSKSENPRGDLGEPLSRFGQERELNKLRWSEWLSYKKRHRYLSDTFLLFQFSGTPFSKKFLLLKRFIKYEFIPKLCYRLKKQLFFKR
jgi:hypothetical protein